MVAWVIWAILALLIIFGIIAVIFFLKNKGKKRHTDYYSFFVMGIIWLPFGLLMRIMDSDSALGVIFIALGISYIALGLAHRKDWKKNHIPFNKLSNKNQKTKIIISIILGILLFIALIIICLIRRGII